MKNVFIKALIVFFTVNMSYSQEWMTNLDIAQKLALVQNKMVLMVWEEATKRPYPVLVNNSEGKIIIVDDLFTDETISPLIWEHFIPVIVREEAYEGLLKKIKGKRSQNYIDKFNDDSIKIMDSNGNIINVVYGIPDYQNITKLIKNYSFNTELISSQLKDYHKDENFYSAYFLASKYLDFSLYSKPNVRSQIIALSNIYLNKAIELLESEKLEDDKALRQRCDLLKIQQYLLLKRPKKVLRELKKMDADKIENSNQVLAASLYYTSYIILKDFKNADIWKPKVSAVNLRKAQIIMNLNS